MSYFSDKKYTLKQVVIFLTIAFSLVTLVSYAAVTIPNTFTAGTTISSSQVNANFDALKTAVDAKQDRPTLGSYPTTSSGQMAWAYMSCPAGSSCWIIHSYNPTGGLVTATTYTTGIGGVTFAGIDVETANIQVTPGPAMGTPRICYVSATVGSQVTARCDNLTGNNTASDFYVLVVR